MKTDTQLQHEVQAELEWDPRLDDTQIGVTVRHGVVTLTGSVPSGADKREAELATHRVLGVDEVEDDLVVRRTDGEACPAA
jgi:osmotically-inducible protein OsmY